MKTRLFLFLPPFLPLPQRRATRRQRNQTLAVALYPTTPFFLFFCKYIPLQTSKSRTEVFFWQAREKPGPTTVYNKPGLLSLFDIS